jgi:hypothetical protein
VRPHRNVFAHQHRQRREVAMMQLRGAEDVVGQQRHVHGGDPVRIALVLIQSSPRY